jgi:dienelactone hydrolase
MRTFAVLFVSMGALLSEARPRDPIAPDEAESRLKELQHVPWTTGPGTTEKEVSSGWSCSEFQLTLTSVDPETGLEETVKIPVHRPRTNKPTPAVIVIPTIEGVTALEPNMARQICDEQMTAVIADVTDRRLPQPMPGWGFEDRQNRRTVQWLRTILDYLEQDARVERQQIGAVGFSLGGIHASLFGAVESSRLKGLVIAVAGANLPGVLSDSRAKQVVNLREERMRATGLDRAGYEEALHGSIRIDPVYLASRVDAAKTLMVLARSDEHVPTPYQDELFATVSASGATPKKVEYGGGHVGTLVQLVFFDGNLITDFIKEKFGLSLATTTQGPSGSAPSWSGVRSGDGLDGHRGETIAEASARAEAALSGKRVQ